MYLAKKNKKNEIQCTMKMIKSITQYKYNPKPNYSDEHLLIFFYILYPC